MLDVEQMGCLNVQMNYGSRVSLAGENRDLILLFASDITVRFALEWSTLLTLV